VYIVYTGSCENNFLAIEEPQPLNYPEIGRLYPNNANCRWSISAPDGYIVQFTIGRIDTEAGFDFIEVCSLFVNEIPICVEMNERVYIVPIHKLYKFLFK